MKKFKLVALLSIVTILCMSTAAFALPTLGTTYTNKFKYTNYEDWEGKNFDNWDDDFAKGDSSIGTDPVYKGKYAVKQRASNAGIQAHFFGDHPGINKKIIEDVTLESYLYFPPNFQWPSGGITVWTMACFESWNEELH